MFKTRTSVLFIAWIAFLTLSMDGFAQMPELRRADPDHVPVLSISHVTGDVYRAAAGENAAKYQSFGFAISSACAEVIADCLLCPMEAVSTFFPIDSIY